MSTIRSPRRTTVRANRNAAEEIAWSIVCEAKMIIEALETDNTPLAPAVMPTTVKGISHAIRGRRAFQEW
jgi:hypothetical protein